jgi:hypothetical protein
MLNYDYAIVYYRSQVVVQANNNQRFYIYIMKQTSELVFYCLGLSWKSDKFLANFLEFPKVSLKSDDL